MSSRYSPAMIRETWEESLTALDQASEMLTDSLLKQVHENSGQDIADDNLREKLRSSFRQQLRNAG